MDNFLIEVARISKHNRTDRRLATPIPKSLIGPPRQATLKKALAMQGPVLVGVPVDYRDNHRLMGIVHPEALN
jgi:hypothetical protein